jgi:hypothetical protein
MKPQDTTYSDCRLPQALDGAWGAVIDDLTFERSTCPLEYRGTNHARNVRQHLSLLVTVSIEAIRRAPNLTSMNPIDVWGGSKINTGGCFPWKKSRVSLRRAFLELRLK